MDITTAGLTRAAAAAAVAAGTIFIAVQIGHPSFDNYTTETTEWVIRGSAKALMTVLALAGLTGMYLYQHRRAGLLGLIGYLVFAAGYLAMFAVEIIAVVVLPPLVGTEPGFVNDVVTASGGGSPSGDIGALKTLFDVTGILYLAGGLLFGIALFRTRVLARWAAALLALSTLGTAALAVLPEAFDRPMAVPEGIALIGLGVSLWRTQRRSSASAAYEVRVAGHLDDHWAATWLDGLSVVRHDDGTTVVTGPVADQSQLHGLLARIRDLGVPLLSLESADPRQPGR